MDKNKALRKVPAVEKLLTHERVTERIDSGSLPRKLVAKIVRGVLDDERRAILADNPPTELDRLADRVLERADASTAPKLKRVVNCTGVILHTNLGRAPLPRSAMEAGLTAGGYCNLEYDLDRGERGSRHSLVEELLCELTGGERAIVVNNNAAAVLLAVTALARGREVVISRGEMVEIGGAFRIPDVIGQGGATLREIGTTNKTKLADYERVINEETAVLLKVHTSNFRIKGFTHAVSLKELVKLGDLHNLAVVEDLGSGCLIDLSRWGLEREPTVSDSVAAGADIVTFSGDKLLGGPQAGIIVGKKEPVESCARHPLMRALRPDKVTLATLESVLAVYRDPQRAVLEVPALRMLTSRRDAMEPRAKKLAEGIVKAIGDAASVVVAGDVSQAGGGSLPLEELPTRVVEVRPGTGVNEIEERLRGFTPPIICRVHDGALVFDPRTILDGEEELVAAGLKAALSR